VPAAVLRSLEPLHQLEPLAAAPEPLVETCELTAGVLEYAEARAAVCRVLVGAGTVAGAGVEGVLAAAVPAIS